MQISHVKSNFQEILQKWGPLFLVSCLSLFMELAVIRWISGEIRILAYFKNLVLLAAFLGLAIGFAVVGKGKDYKGSFPWLWVIFVVLVLVTGKLGDNAGLVYPGGGDEALWGISTVSFWTSMFIFIAFVIVFFFLILFLFIPLGQITGEEMAKHLPIPAYIINILASLVGIWLFSLISYINTPPVIWFTLSILGISCYFAITHKLSWRIIIAFCVTLIGIGLINPKTIWSPYNRLDLAPSYFGQSLNKLQIGYRLTVQHYFYQGAYDFSDTFVDKVREMFPEIIGRVDEYVEGYNLPYSLAPINGRVLIVGSGMGNDVAAALRSQMGQITAVEIDPTILSLGQRYHPEIPYSDPRVTSVVDDARSYFEKNENMYDVIVFGLLDSHTLLSSMASVRLDSYVYTLESFQQAKSHLNPNGYITLTFAATEWIRERLGRMLAEVFGKENVFFRVWEGGVTFIAGENIPRSSVLKQFSQWEIDPVISKLPLATDNWPYIYLRSLRIPAGYWQILLVIGLLCMVMMARTFPEALKPNWHFWLLGAAFLLIEFKSITELALLFGTTWFVNSLAISGVLIMALLANLVVLRTVKVNLQWVYTFLFVSLFLGYFFPLASLSGYPPLIKGSIGTIILTSPLFFSGIIFSESMKRYGEISKPMASNFSGSAFGGILEYGSIWWGIKGLYIVAIVIYVGAMIAAIKGKLLSR